MRYSYLIAMRIWVRPKNWLADSLKLDFAQREWQEVAKFLDINQNSGRTRDIL